MKKKNTMHFYLSIYLSSYTMYSNWDDYATTTPCNMQHTTYIINNIIKLLFIEKVCIPFYYVVLCIKEVFLEAIQAESIVQVLLYLQNVKAGSYSGNGTTIIPVDTKEGVLRESSDISNTSIRT